MWYIILLNIKRADLIRELILLTFFTLSFLLYTLSLLLILYFNLVLYY